MGIMVIVRRLVKSVLYAGGFYIEWIQLWFLPHLFIVSIFAYIILKYVSNQYARWIILAAGLALSQQGITYFWPFHLAVSGNTYNYQGLPYSLDLTLICGFFFLLGNEFGKLNLQGILGNWLLFTASFLGLLALNLYSSARLDLFMRTFDSLWVNTSEAILGIIFVLTLSVQIEQHFSKVKSVLTYFGWISIFVLIFHWYIQETLRVKLLKLTENPSLVVLGSFLGSLLGSIFIYELFIKPNAVVSFLFGVGTSKMTEKKLQVERSQH
jgi:fucose 4-O-acetylase-like acetyltransferase